ncbi:hypothetical protein K439DRAFT_1627589 [Ramaria rubella]|nr:hypothetical protein K439DRAFT_1627589 [Ramaria rubella]
MSVDIAPSVFLPSLRKLQTCTEEQISNAISSLRHIYTPEVRGSTRRRQNHVKHPAHSGSVNLIENTLASQRDHLEAIRADTFERSFAIQWLTRFISLYSPAVDSGDDFSSSHKINAGALEEAASLLAICAGASASGTIIRTFRFPLQALHTSHEVSVMLRDAPLVPGDFSSVGALTWGGSCILAEMIAEDPSSFGILSKEGASSHHSSSRAPFRALELGAGTGLASLVLGKTMEQVRSIRKSSNTPNLSPSLEQDADTLIATDFHPTVLANLQSNFALNFSPQPPDLPVSPLHTSVLPLDWATIHDLCRSELLTTKEHLGVPKAIPKNEEKTSHALEQQELQLNRFHHTADFPSSTESNPRTIHNSTLLQPRLSNADPGQTGSEHPPSLNQPFDLIIGADIIYEQLHARWVRSCVERFLKKPPYPFSPAGISCMLPDTTISTSTPLLYHPDHPPPPLFHLIIPLRLTHAIESRSIEEVFAPANEVLRSRQYGPNEHDYSEHQSQHSHGSTSSNSPGPESFAISELAIIHQEDIVCDAYSDTAEAEDVVYRYYKIGWV